MQKSKIFIFCNLRKEYSRQPPLPRPNQDNFQNNPALRGHKGSGNFRTSGSKSNRNIDQNKLAQNPGRPNSSKMQQFPKPNPKFPPQPQGNRFTKPNYGTPYNQGNPARNTPMKGR